MKLVTVPDVEVLKVGEFDLSSGPHVFTKEQLAAAVRNAEARTPRLGIGHVDSRFDGQPALGSFRNFRLEDDGMTVKADIESVPDWLAAAMPSAYPSRSIEGSVKDDDLTITAVKLMGMQMPGVSTLADIQQMFSDSGPVLLAAGEGSDGQVFTLAFGEVIEASSTPPTQSEELTVELTAQQKKVRSILGLAEDATEDELDAAIVAEEEAQAAATAEVEEYEVEVEHELVTASGATVTIPEGMLLVDESTLGELQIAASAGVAAREVQLEQHRTTVVAAAVSDGRIPPARSEHWIKQLESDPESESILASLAPGLIPTDERGKNTSAETTDNTTPGTGLLPELASKEA